MKLVAASAAEAELDAFFLNTRLAKIIRLILEELGHPQPQIPIHSDNTTTIGIVNNTIKRQKSRAMEMRYFWLLDSEAQKYFKFHYHPGLENLADYASKAHDAANHRHARPYYLHSDFSPRTLVRALMPSTRRGCVKPIRDSYLRRQPLPVLRTSTNHNKLVPAAAAA